MSFAKDFAANIDTQRADLMARRAEIIDQVYNIFFPDGQQVFDLSPDSRALVALLNVEEERILSEVASIDVRKALYYAREKEQRRIKWLEKRAKSKRLAKAVSARYTPSQTALPSMLPSAEIGCSLGGAEPPWQWTWGIGNGLGFVAFSDMLPIPHFHFFDLLGR